MSHSIAVRKTYKYRLYRCDKRDQHQQINIAGTVWNHALALQKRYYRLLANANCSLCFLENTRFAVGSRGAGTTGRWLPTLFKRLAKRPPKYKKVRRGIGVY
jgi:hypothetical protein